MLESPSALREQILQLWRHLDSVFDADLVKGMATRLLAANSTFSAIRPLAFGKHFHAFKIQLRDLPCVLKIPRYLFDPAFPNHINRVWSENMRVLTREVSTFVAPFKILPFQDSYIQVMVLLDTRPLAAADLAQAASGLDADLNALGLRNYDALQFGTYKGMPLAFDLSEVRRS